MYCLQDNSMYKEKGENRIYHYLMFEF